MLNRKPLALYLAALFVFCVSGCSKRDNDSSGDSGDSAIVECISLDNFSDKAFGEYAISRWDLDGDKCISQSEASKITEIPKQAFKNNNIIESIDDLNLFPSITTLREEAFAGCIKIKTANLKYIQIVEQYTFSGTTYLPNVETVLSHAFEGTSLESVSLPKATYVGECAFVGVSTLKTLDLPNVETVGEYAFFGTSLESVSLPKATYVGDHAFCDVSTLKTLDLPNVETVDGWAFGFTSLESVSLPVETVDGWALSGTSLESVSLPKAIRMCRFLSNNCHKNDMSWPELQNKDYIHDAHAGAYNHRTIRRPRRDPCQTFRTMHRLPPAKNRRIFPILAAGALCTQKTDSTTIESCTF